MSAGTTAQATGLQLALTKLGSNSSFAQTPLPEESTLGGVLVNTFSDLLAQLEVQSGLLSAADFRDLFDEAQAIVGATFSREIEKSNAAWAELENFGRAHIDGFTGFSETPEHAEPSPEPKEARNYADRNRLLSEDAKRKIPLWYRRYGQALINHYSSQHSLRSLKTLVNRFPNELDGIGAINRATLDRVQKARTSKHGFKGQSKAISASTADLDNALKLHGKQWTAPTQAEISAADLFVDGTLGTLTSIPEN